MNRRKLLVAVGVGCFVVFMLALAPARLLTSLVPSGIATISDTSGTLWTGGAQSVSVAGFQLREVEWELHPLPLLIGRLSLALDAKWGDGYVQGNASVGLTGSVRLRAVRIAGPLDPVMQRMNLRGSGGELAVDFAALEVANQWPTRVIGTVRVGRVPLSALGVAGAATGNYRLEFDIEEVGDDGAIPGVLSDGGGPLEIFGELRLMPPRDYTVQARVTARPDAPADLVTGLMLVGPKQPDGSHQFQMSGSL